VNSINQIAHTRGRKVLIAIWVLILIILIGFAIAGYIKNQFIGYVFASFFPAAILADITSIISYKAEKTGRKLVKTGWSLLCIFVLAFTLAEAIVNSQSSGKYLVAGIFIIYPMMILSFPSCFLWLYPYGWISFALDYIGISGSLNFGEASFYVVNFILWLGFFIVGYLQWFKLLPFLLEKWRSRRSHASPT
jgi:hypothetical protein